MPVPAVNPQLHQTKHDLTTYNSLSKQLYTTTPFDRTATRVMLEHLIVP